MVLAHMPAGRQVPTISPLASAGHPQACLRPAALARLPKGGLWSNCVPMVSHARTAGAGFAALGSVAGWGRGAGTCGARGAGRGLRSGGGVGTAAPAAALKYVAAERWSDPEEDDPYLPSPHAKRDTKRKAHQSDNMAERLKRAKMRRAVWDTLINPKRRPSLTKKDREAFEEACLPETGSIFDSIDHGNAVCLHLIGEMLQEYPPGGPIGEGTYSDVYEAGEAGGAVLKCSLPFPGMKSGVRMGSGMEVTVTEARILESVPPHPHVVELLSAHVDRRRHEGMVLLKYAGVCLHDLRAQGEVSPRQVRRVAEEILGALVHLHQHGVVHRDLKASNIMISEDDGRATLIDFGVSRSQDLEDIFDDPSDYGTSGYQALELIVGRVDSDKWAKVDVFAMACTIFYLVTGVDLFLDPLDLAAIGKTDGEITPEDELESLARFEETRPRSEDVQYLKSLEKVDIRYQPSEPWVEGGLCGYLERCISEEGRQPPELADLLFRMLARDPQDRCTAEEALSAIQAINRIYP